MFFMALFSYISMVSWMGEPQGSPGGDSGFAALFSSPPTSLQTLVVKTLKSLSEVNMTT
ncbi:MAG: hypothetical protein G5701_09940 [Serratia symbiotica]|nr:hypothetical protein [Serratia symbiotica]